MNKNLLSTARPTAGALAPVGARASVGAPAALALALALAGCSMAPPLKVPEVATAAAYRETAPWVTAAPADALPREAWWTVYGDADLNALEQRLAANSPDIAAALARYQQAYAIGEQSRTGLFPSVGLAGNAQRLRQSETKPLRVLGPNSPNDYSSDQLNLQVDYEVDLWGRVRNTVAAGSATERAAQADLASALLSLQAQLADNYIVLRGLDAQIALLRDTDVAYTKALDLTTNRHEGGASSGIDVARAQAQVGATRSQASQAQAQRALSEHAIAALIGESASNFTIPARSGEIRLPNVPAGLPSTLLQRRPDIAAAQRRVVAANASIGVAKAAFFPAVTLSATGGYQSNSFGDFLRAPNAFWAVGPSMFLTLFDAGKRKAEVARTQAVLDENAARYRGTVLTAFQQVEDNLALLNHYRNAADSDRLSLAASQRALGFATTRYREGAVNYLEVVIAQSTALQAQRSALDLDTLQRRASVQLIRALGGGWQEGDAAPVVGAP